MTTLSCDALVIGSGQAGPALAVRLAEHGWKTAFVERGELGGTSDRDHGEMRVMPAQGERQDGLLSRTCQQKDRVEHRVS